MSNRRIISLITAILFLIVSVTGAAISRTHATAPEQPVQHPVLHSSSTVDVWYPVVRVVDGDTLVVKKDGADIKIRLIGLDTPEVVDPRKPVQCFGRAASDEAHRVLDGTVVRLEMDPSQGEYDKYKRTLAYVFFQQSSTSSEILFNKYMIERGFGHEYTYNLPYLYQAEFKAAEKEAREAGRGLWAPGVCGS